MLNMPQIAPEAFLPTQSRQTPCLTIFHPLGLAALHTYRTLWRPPLTVDRFTAVGDAS